MASIDESDRMRRLEWEAARSRYGEEQARADADGKLRRAEQRIAELERERDEAREKLRNLVEAIDAETEASKVWYQSRGNSEA